MKIRTLIAAAVAALGIMACTSSSTDETIQGKKFIVTELNGTEYISMGDEPAFICFDAEGLYASVGGNIINAQYSEGKDGALKVSMGLSTKMMVPDEFREDEFEAAVNSIACYAIDGSNVTFYNADGTAVIAGALAE